MASANWPLDRTLFQEGDPYGTRYDLRTDAAIVYGIDESLPQRVAGWKMRGYRVHLMTGLAWGHYEDYIQGRWDGQEHWDDAQRLADGRPKLHSPTVPYIVPSEPYATYLEELLRQGIDAGVDAIFLEEPEFWSYTGYGPGFERAFQAQHGVPWRDPAADPQTFLLAAQVKQTLYRQLIARLCGGAKRYSAERPSGPVRCYVATHSLLNYTAWGIVSPELSLATIPDCDGAIVQTWSRTARVRTVYRGRHAERVFAVAFLEYGSGLELARGPERDRHLWFLTDPIEDDPKHGWDFYREGYQATVAAALFFPQVGAYEVMPWPMRVLTGRYPRRPEGPPGEPIPGAYASQLLAIANALRAMPDGPLEWDCGTEGLGILVSDTMMLRRGGPRNDDGELSSFYGLALPLVLAAMPLLPVGLELLAARGVPESIHTLLLSYDGMTPPDEAVHAALARWVRAGGTLLCFGAGNGPYELLPGWWNGGAGGDGPWLDLFERLGLSAAPIAGLHRAGVGIVWIAAEGPVTLAALPDGASTVRAILRTALGVAGRPFEYRQQSYMTLRRGPYLVASVLEEADGAAPLQLSGRYVDLFDGNLPIRDEVTLQPGDQALLIDLARLIQPAPCVVAAAARIDLQHADDRLLRFTASGPEGTTAAIRVLLARRPIEARADGETLPFEWDAASSTALLRGPNMPAGTTFTVRW